MNSFGVNHQVLMQFILSIQICLGMQVIHFKRMLSLEFCFLNELIIDESEFARGLVVIPIISPKNTKQILLMPLAILRL